MNDYEVFHLGEETGVIIEADNLESALKKVDKTGIHFSKNSINLVLI